MVRYPNGNEDTKKVSIAHSEIDTSWWQSPYGCLINVNKETKGGTDEHYYYLYFSFPRPKNYWMTPGLQSRYKGLFMRTRKDCKTYTLIYPTCFGDKCT